MTKQLKVDSVVNVAGTGKPNFPVSPTSGGAALSTLNTHSYTSSATEPSSPKNGAIWWDSANSKVYVYANGEFKEISLNTDYPSAYSLGIDWGGTRHVYSCYEGSGSSAINTDTIQYFSSAASAGTTAQDFGNLSAARLTYAATSSQTRGLFIGSAGGSNISSDTSGQVIDYITIATTGNATDFGDLYFIEQSSYVLESQNATGNGTRGIIFGGYSSWTGTKNNIEYVTIANTGNAADFGDLGEANRQGGACSDATRAVYARGTNGTNNGIEYVTIDTTGNATSFGTQTVNHAKQFAGCSDATRGIFAGGDTGVRINSISYITIQTTGNSTDFGDMTGPRSRLGCTSDGTYGTMTGGRHDGSLPDGAGGTTSTWTNRIDRITIQTAGNATDFGDTVNAASFVAACAGNPS